LKLKITVDGKAYEVDVEVSEPEPPPPGSIRPGVQARVPAAAPPASSSASQVISSAGPVADETKVCRSPFSGMVASVAARAGQSIQVNDVLLVLEAMKMETVITAPIAGKVVRINANVGDTVQKGQVLVEFE
jgi:biotin carboxyl carrier protein